MESVILSTMMATASPAMGRRTSRAHSGMVSTGSTTSVVISVEVVVQIVDELVVGKVVGGEVVLNVDDRLSPVMERPILAEVESSDCRGSVNLGLGL